MKYRMMTIAFVLLIACLISLSLTSLSTTLSSSVKDHLFTDEDVDMKGQKHFNGEYTELDEEAQEGTEVEPLLEAVLSPFIGEDTSKTKRNYLLFSLLALCTGITGYFIYRKYRKNQQGKDKSTPSSPVAAKNDEEVSVEYSPSLKNESQSNIHLVRKYLQKWEKTLGTHNQKRPAETINEWFKRINGPMEIIPIYEKVRYGESGCSEKELQLVKRVLKL
ncbi:hypothetical protein LCD52_12855 [Rossellomorea vietnamensis]|uniref:hypothetical protein n=1 Tax=Rossellomorea vietnamensis TaxID=218284 RepID=UPI001CCF337F|nr:hypothetical protein [Rossellomorea vietnamensis]MCA0149683.1 hypothetical protein [Rossellomorea vietnamensis]